MKYYIRHTDNIIYTGDMQPGDREATEEEIYAHEHPVLTIEDITAKRAELYRELVDPKVCEYNRKHIEGYPHEELVELKKVIAELTQKIKDENPYPALKGGEVIPGCDFVGDEDSVA